MTYAAPLRVRARLLNKETGEIKESEVFMGDFPDDRQRHLHHQRRRAGHRFPARPFPGVYYGMSYDTTGKKLFTSTVIPNRGAWLEYETDSSDVFYVRIDKNRKLPVTVFVRALGLGSDAELLDFFGDDERIHATIEKDITKNTEEALLEVYRKLRPGEPLDRGKFPAASREPVFRPPAVRPVPVGRYKYNKKLGIANRLAGCRLSRPVVDPLTGEVLNEAGDLIGRARAIELEDAGVSVAYVVVDDHGESREIKIISNGMVDIGRFVDFDCGSWASTNGSASRSSRRSWKTTSRRRTAGKPSANVPASWCPTISLWMISSRPSTISTASATTSATSTTSTIWATAGSGRWASCCKTSSASGSPGWSGSSGNA